MRKPSPEPRSGPRRGTRDRLLDLACDLFNERGTERVTTRLIADTAGINEGNLYYHFRTKEALFVALFGRFEAEALSLFDGNAAPESGLLRRWFLLSWRFRFLFRDALALHAAAPKLRPRLLRLVARLQSGTRAVFAALAEAGLIRIEPAAEERLLANLWIVSSYWMSFLVLHSGTREVTQTHLAWGFDQVRSLYAPYLTEAGRAQLLLPPPDLDAVMVVSQA